MNSCSVFASSKLEYLKKLALENELKKIISFEFKLVNILDLISYYYYYYYYYQISCFSIIENEKNR